MPAIETTIGYLLFALSEILPVLPIPANGFLHSFVIGLKNSLKNSNIDIEMARNAVKNPDNAKIINVAMSNPDITNSLNILINNGNIIPYIKIIKDNPRLRYIITLLNNHKDLISNIELSIEDTIYQNKQNTQKSNITSDNIVPKFVIPNDILVSQNDNSNSQNLISSI